MQLATQRNSPKVGKEIELDTARFAQEVRRLRGKRTQTQLAEEAYIAQTYISDIENQKGNPSAEVIIKLAHALGVDSGDLFRILDKEAINKNLTEYIKFPPTLSEEDKEMIKWLVNRLAGAEPAQEVPYDPAREAIEREWAEEERALEKEKEREKENNTH